MKKRKHIADATDIGDSSFMLISFTQLPKRASVKRQIEALKSDKDVREELWEIIRVKKVIDYRKGLNENNSARNRNCRSGAFLVSQKHNRS